LLKIFEKLSASRTRRETRCRKAQLNRSMMFVRPDPFAQACGNDYFVGFPKIVHESISFIPPDG